MVCVSCRTILEAVNVCPSVRILVHLPNLELQENTFDTDPTGRAKMFALETAAEESNSLFYVLRRASTTGYNDVVDVLRILTSNQTVVDRERTNSVKVLL